MRNPRCPRRQQVPVALPKRAGKRLSKMYFRPQLIRLEERLPLGDAPILSSYRWTEEILL